MNTAGRMTMALISFLAPLAAACNGSEASVATTPESVPDSTVVSEPVQSSASTSEPADTADALRAAVVDGNLDHFRGSVLVAHGDDVLLSEGFGAADVAAGIPNDPTTIFRIGSVTKQFTGMAILILSEQDLLDVNSSVCDYLTPCPDAWRPITIENLVAHTSGIPDFTALADYEATKAVPTTPDALIGRVRDLPLERAPGTNFSYSNSNYAVLGAVIERVSDTTWEEFLRTNIFDPLGMSDTGYETAGDRLAVGYSNGDEEADAIDMSRPYGGGALSSTVTDLLRWNQAIASGTAAAGDATKDMLTPVENITDFAGFGYGYGIYVSTKEDGPLAFHSGGIDGFSSVLLNDVGNDITVVILSNTENSGDLVSTASELRAIALAG